ncbi:ATP-binding protein [Aquamicrobium terrae]|uniref:AAA+ ATPase domain-containing protein n=1 Tax=Aquamicrobium terrae TaxID=1324945 RepID=A0ABV2MYM2_9HYPH
MDSRLAKHLLRRLRHQAQADAVARAAGAKLLTERRVPVAGRWVHSFVPGPLSAGRSQAEIARMLDRLGRSGSVSRDDSAPEGEDIAAASDAPEASADHGDSKPDAASLLRAVRQSAEPLRAADVATMLLLTRSITMSATPLGEILEALRLPTPIITLTGRVAGFEEVFLDLLERGLILPGKVATCNGNTFSRDYGFRFSHVPDAHWRIVVFAATNVEPEDRERMARKVAFVARSHYPILGISEDEDRLPGPLRQAARINLVCGPLDMGIIRETMRAVLGEVPEGCLPHDHASALTLADLALAIRSGTSAKRALAILDGLARMRLASAAEEENDSGVSNRKESGRKETGGTTATKSKPGRSSPGSGSERIEPTAPTGTDTDRFIPRVETLSGYGEATAWAFDLKEDMALWRAGQLGWADMSAKLLLSGPPGTGKTTFARALCNTLQVPLIATSVATWMEPGYLGDVLIRMNATFAEAEAAKPAILFVDEIDGINMRGSAGEWTTYWDQIVNRLLELLDGASRSDGVVVIGATNNPDRIDKALLRSGRLERHIVIPKPDTEALIGILRHHLKDDLDAVIASAPKRETGRAGAGATDDSTATDAATIAAGDPPAIASRRNPPAE